MILSNNSLPLQLTFEHRNLLEDVVHSPTLQPFESVVFEFLAALSHRLMSDPKAKTFSELVALGFWLRRSNLNNITNNYQSKFNHEAEFSLTKPLGTLVHFCPANVDTMFVYSWICSLLVGNNNIVRVSGRTNPLQQTLMILLAQLFQIPEYRGIAQRNLIVTWPHEDQLTARVCSLVDGRVIWGGDETVNKIRSFPCQPRARDITFADRFSVCLVNTEQLEAKSVQQLAELLWRDSKVYQQAACSSPRVIIWCGGEHPWQFQVVETLKQLAENEPDSPARAMNHLVTSQLVRGAESDNIENRGQRVTFQKINTLSSQYLAWHPADYYWYELQVKSLTQAIRGLPPLCQTLSYFGFELAQLQSELRRFSGKGIDRVVPVGQALNFCEIWDGYHLLSQLSRQIQLV